MKILIAGYGSIGRRHMRNLMTLGISDLIIYHTGHSTLPDNELIGVMVVNELKKALDYHPDAVVVANPTALHMDIAIPAAKSGCHIFLEKPVSNNLERIKELKQALANNNKQALVGFQFRFHQGLKRIEQLLKDGAIGRPLTARAHWGEYLPDWHPWEDYRASYSARADLGGGVVLTLCHPLDYLRWLLGEVDFISAFTAKMSDLEIRVEDTAEIILHFAHGGIGSVHLNYHQKPTIHQLEISGTTGTILWDNADGSVRLYRAASQNWESFTAPEGFERNQLFLAEMSHFLDVINGKSNPLCTLNDGERVQQIINAVYLSSREQRRVKL